MDGAVLIASYLASGGVSDGETPRHTALCSINVTNQGIKAMTFLAQIAP
jgi:hypothetical protein